MTSNGSPKVSFVVPCHNYGRYLGDCLRGIFSQAERDLEIIVIDDGSSDDTQEVLRSFGDDRLRVITHAVNRGHVDTINEGLLLARGRYVCRIDPDDRHRSDFLSRTLAVFERHPDVGVVYSNIAMIDAEGRVTCDRSESAHKGDFKGSEYLALLEKNFVPAPTLIARREAWAETLPIPTGLSFSDWYLNLKLAQKNIFYYVDAPLAEYRVHGANWHTRISRDRTEEASLFRILDSFMKVPEADPAQELGKRRVARRVYAAQYLLLGDKYFWHGHGKDARRCYVHAVAKRPKLIFTTSVVRRWVATLLPARLYSAAKQLLQAPS